MGVANLSWTVIHSCETTTRHFLPFPSLCLASQNTAKVPKFHAPLFFLSPRFFHPPSKKTWWLQVLSWTVVYGEDIPGVGPSNQKHVHRVAGSISIRQQAAQGLSWRTDLTGIQFSGVVLNLSVINAHASGTPGALGLRSLSPSAEDALEQNSDQILRKNEKGTSFQWDLPSCLLRC